MKKLKSIVHLIIAYTVITLIKELYNTLPKTKERMLNFKQENDKILNVIGMIFVALVIVGLIYKIIVISKNYKSLFILQEKTNRSLSDTAKRERDANKAKTDFLSKISHDIRTPINGIMGMVKIAEENVYDTEKVLDSLDNIKVASKHLFSLINDVLDMSSIEKGKLVLNHHQFDIEKLFKEIVTIVSYQAKLKGLSVNVNQNIINKKVTFDEVRLQQILVNILGNSVKFTDPGGDIYLSVEEAIQTKELSNFRFVITDNGMGMTDELIASIYEPFVQGEKAREQNNYIGSGLGMSIVKGLIDVMEGEISIKSEIGKGSTFIIDIPISTKVIEEKSEKEVEDMSLKGKKIMIVDDNELNLEIVDYMLKKHGVETKLVKNGFTAYQIMKDSKVGEYDLILMDILMPVLDGIESTIKIRALEREYTKNIPIIGITANAYSCDEEKSISAGMNAHISKPVIEEKLIKEIKCLL